MQDHSGVAPPGADGVDRERGSVVVGAHRHPSGVGAHVVHPVRVGFTQLLVDEVMDLHLFGLALGMPLPTVVLVGPDQLFLLGVHTDHRVPGRQVSGRLLVEVGELGVAIDMLPTLGGLGIGLQTVAPLTQQSTRHHGGDLVASLPQRPGQDPDRLRRPPQRRHRIAPGLRIDQRLQRGHQLRIVLLGPFTSTTGPTRPPLTGTGPGIGLGAPPTHRVGCDSGRPSHHRDTSRPQLGRLRAQPQPTLELRQKRTHHRIPSRQRVSQIRHSTTVVPK